MTEIGVFSRESILVEIARESRPGDPIYFFYNMDAWLPGGFKTRFNWANINNKLENGKTGAETVEQFSQAAKECGYSQKQIENARDKAHAWPSKKKPLAQILTDVYINLRLKGFKKEEIIGF